MAVTMCEKMYIWGNMGYMNVPMDSYKNGILTVLIKHQCTKMISIRDEGVKE